MMIMITLNFLSIGSMTLNSVRVCRRTSCLRRRMLDGNGDRSKTLRRRMREHGSFNESVVDDIMVA